MIDMKAVGLLEYLPIEREDSLFDFKATKPTATGKDLLVKINAISINPVDVKVRAPKEKKEETPKVLGWDASGVVVEVGEDCELFQPGDEVFYAGAINRPGTYSEYHLVDERIVGKKPTSLSFAEAAAMPLTTITAWEALFERLAIHPENKQENNAMSILIIGGAGGVGSIAIQLAKWAGLEVIATASRSETENWVKQLGADHIINHYEPLKEQLATKQLLEVDYILCLNNTDQHWEAMGEVIKPQGKICSIVENEQPLDLNVLKSKSATFVWEFMFTKSLYTTPDIMNQHVLLNKASEMMDQNVIKTTLQEKLSPICAETLRKAHAKVESGKMIGKLVVEGFEAD